jgi:hypothetical protein
MEIKEALAQLDVLDDDQWTTEGLPRVDAVEKILGSTVSRADITNADPSFNRSLASSDGEPLETPDQNETPELEPTSEPVMDPLDLKEAELQSEIEDLSLLASQKSKELEVLKKQIAELAARQNSKTSVLERMRRLRPKRADSSAIGAYLAQAARTREERAKRALAFIAGGTSISDVLAQLSIKAPIDVAMNKRKAAPGSTRPALHMPVRK